MRDIDWKILFELYRTPNITKVADKLFMTQPTLTKRIQCMEEEMNIKIVDRSTKGVTFTEEGEYLAHQAELYLQFRGGIKRRLEAFRENEAGTIRLASSTSFAEYYLPDLIREYTEHHPNVTFDVEHAKSHELLRFLKEGVSDMAFLRGEYECDLKKIRLFTEQAYAIASVPIARESLFTMKRIDCSFGEHSQKLIDQWWDDFTKTPPAPAVRVRMVETSWSLAQQGVGYTIGFFEKNQLKHLGVSAMPLYFSDGRPLQRNTWLIYSEHLTRSPYAQEFIRQTEQYFHCRYPQENSERKLSE